jgi:hypothetical protein
MRKTGSDSRPILKWSEFGRGTGLTLPDDSNRLDRGEGVPTDLMAANVTGKPGPRDCPTRDEVDAVRVFRL